MHLLSHQPLSPPYRPIQTGAIVKRKNTKSESNITEPNNSIGSIQHRTPLHLQQNSGDSKSLASLTVRFVELLESISPPFGTGELDLNDAMNSLGVQKRRLYDVSNVLEGIGLIKKENKNSVSWIEQVSPMPSAMTGNAGKQMKAEVKSLKSQRNQLDQYIDTLSKQVKKYTIANAEGNGRDNSKSSQLYVTKRDISSIRNFANDTVVAIRAPSGTSLEVPNPDEGMRPGMRRFQIFLTTPSGQVNVCLVQHGEKKEIGRKSKDISKFNEYSDNPKSQHWNSSYHQFKGQNSTYPIQAPRPQQHFHALHTRNYPPPPQLPPAECFPKYTTPMNPDVLPHRPLWQDYAKRRPRLPTSRRHTTQLDSRPKLLQRRPSDDTMPYMHKTSSSTAEVTSKKREGMKDPSDNLPLNKKKKLNDRAISPLPTIIIDKFNKSPFTTAITSNDPDTPSNVTSGGKILKQSSFDLLNAPLHSPSTAFLSSPADFLASPSVTRGGIMQVIGTSAMLNSPFRFSPNFQLGDLSPFCPLRSDNRMEYSEKIENDDRIPSALF